MNRILLKRLLAPDIFLFEVEAPRIASRSKAGQFVIVRPLPNSERIPLTIVDASPARGVITLVVQVVGLTTKIIAGLKTGDPVADVLGPLGRPTEVQYIGHVACVGGGVGAALLLPVIRAMRSVGNRVTALCGARSSTQIILSQEIAFAAGRALWATNDGSFGLRGNVVELLQTWLPSLPSPPGLVYLAGPVAMMKAAAVVTRQWSLRTVASLNPIMIDGIGMCGGCRVSVGGAARFACVEGPEFDAHQVDFDELALRNRGYAQQECQAMRGAEIGAADALAGDAGVAGGQAAWIGSRHASCNLTNVIGPGGIGCRK